VFEKIGLVKSGECWERLFVKDGVVSVGVRDGGQVVEKVGMG
jgi:hypothetical protein